MKIGVIAGAIVCVTNPLVAQDKMVHFWFSVSDSELTNGEEAEVTLFCEFSPTVGAVSTYKDLPATVLFFQGKSLEFVVEAPSSPGQFTYQQINPSIADWFNFYGTPVGNKIVLVTLLNWYPAVNPVPYTKNPLWLYKYRWRPERYIDDDVVVTFTSGYDYVAMAMEVPALNKYFPDFAYDQWPYVVTSNSFRISDGICDPDCDDSGELDIDDCICFQTLFAVGDPKADCDADGQLLIDDFICFQTLYAIGC